MNIFIVYAHPQPFSLNAALKDQSIKLLQQFGHKVNISDLYQMRFKAIADWQDFSSENTKTISQYGTAQQLAFESGELCPEILTEQEKLSCCDLIIFQFPLWWFSMPAIMKGWLDRVLTPGFAYNKGQWFDTGLLKPKRAVLMITTQSPETAYSNEGMHEVINKFLVPINHTLKFAGLQILAPFVIYDAMTTDTNLQYQHLTEHAQFINQLQEQLTSING